LLLPLKLRAPPLKVKVTVGGGATTKNLYAPIEGFEASKEALLISNTVPRPEPRLPTVGAIPAFFAGDPEVNVKSFPARSVYCGSSNTQLFLVSPAEKKFPDTVVLLNAKQLSTSAPFKTS